MAYTPTPGVDVNPKPKKESPPSQLVTKQPDASTTPTTATVDTTKGQSYKGKSASQVYGEAQRNAAENKATTQQEFQAELLKKQGKDVTIKDGNVIATSGNTKTTITKYGDYTVTPTSAKVSSEFVRQQVQQVAKPTQTLDKPIPGLNQDITREIRGEAINPVTREDAIAFLQKGLYTPKRTVEEYGRKVQSSTNNFTYLNRDNINADQYNYGTNRFYSRSSSEILRTVPNSNVSNLDNKSFQEKINENFDKRLQEYKEAGQYLSVKRQEGTITQKEKLASIPIFYGYVLTRGSKAASNIVLNPIETGKSIISYFTLPFRPKTLVETGIRLGTEFKQEPVGTATDFLATAGTFKAIGIGVSKITPKVAIVSRTVTEAGKTSKEVLIKSGLETSKSFEYTTPSGKYNIKVGLVGKDFQPVASSSSIAATPLLAGSQTLMLRQLPAEKFAKSDYFVRPKAQSMYVPESYYKQKSIENIDAARQQLISEIRSGQVEGIPRASVRRELRKQIVKEVGKPKPYFSQPIENKPVITQADSLSLAKQRTIDDFRKGLLEGIPRASIRKEIRKDILAKRSIAPLKIPSTEDVYYNTFYTPTKAETTQRAKENAREQVIRELEDKRRSLLEARADVRREVKRRYSGQAKSFYLMQGGYKEGQLFDLPIAIREKPIKKSTPFIYSQKPQENKKPTIYSQPKKEKEFMTQDGQILLMKEPEVQKPKVKVLTLNQLAKENKQKLNEVQRTEQKSLFKASQQAEYKTDQRFETGLKEKRKLNMPIFIIPASESISKNIRKPSSISTPSIKQTPISTPKPDQLFKPIQESKPEQKPISFAKSFSSPKPTPQPYSKAYQQPRSESIVDALSKNFQKQKFAQDFDSKKFSFGFNKAYDVQIKRGKNFETISRGQTEGRGFKMLSDYLQKNLRATGRLVEAGKTTQEDIDFRVNQDVFRNYKIVKGQKVFTPLQIIQREGKRLGSQGEVSEIQMFKKLKNKRF